MASRQTANSTKAARRRALSKLSFTMLPILFSDPFQHVPGDSGTVSNTGAEIESEVQIPYTYNDGFNEDHQ
ncbi:MAG: hypothetical protein ABFC89_13035 [Methanospirillum sp.]